MALRTYVSLLRTAVTLCTAYRHISHCVQYEPKVLVEGSLPEHQRGV
jgi:hypothetical protein